MPRDLPLYVATCRVNYHQRGRSVGFTFSERRWINLV